MKAKAQTSAQQKQRSNLATTTITILLAAAGTATTSTYSVASVKFSTSAISCAGQCFLHLLHPNAVSSPRNRHFMRQLGLAIHILSSMASHQHSHLLSYCSDLQHSSADSMCSKCTHILFGNKSEPQTNQRTAPLRVVVKSKLFICFEIYDFEFWD